jgi:subtilisin family serine protease
MAAVIVCTLVGCSGGDGTAASAQATPNTAAAPAPTTTASSLSDPGCYYHYTLTDLRIGTGDDPLLARQWHLNNTGQTGGTSGEDLRVLAAWPLVKGAGARVVIVDDAVEIVHPDLAPNVVSGASHNYRPATVNAAWPLPCGQNDEHGTSVAGLATASVVSA